MSQVRGSRMNGSHNDHERSRSGPGEYQMSTRENQARCINEGGFAIESPAHLLTRLSEG
jgi:hypothetical protein